MPPITLEDGQPLPGATLIDGFKRLALGEVGALGGLYDARTDRILPNSFLRSTAPLEKVVVSQKMPTLTYRFTTTDSLEEKLSNLDISANLGLSVLCGLVESNLTGHYILKKKHKDHVREASAICSIQTVAERLVFENLDSTYLNFDALKTAGATHVIYGLDWGARTVVKVMEKVTSRDDTSDIRGNASGSRGASGKKSGDANMANDMGQHSSKQDGAKEDTQSTGLGAQASDLMGKVVNNIGHVSVGGKLDMDDKLIEKISNFDFEIITDVSDHSIPDLPKDFEGVVAYIQAMPGRLRGVNGDKGVPQAFYLRSIHDIASAFNETISQINLMNRIDQSSLVDVARRLDEFESINQKFSDREHFLREHSFCVPKAQLKDAKGEKQKATGIETEFKDSLREIIAGIRKGEIDSGSLAKLLESEVSSGDENDQSSDTLQKYVRKAKFAAAAKKRGAEYASRDGDEKASAIHGRFEQVFVLHISADAQAHEVWPVTRQKVWDLLDLRRPDDVVLIEDHDIVGTKPSKLDRPIIQKFMGGELQVKDVVEDDKDLAAKCLIRCIDSSIIKFPRNTRPNDRLPVKMRCPSTNCLNDRAEWWSCPNCRKQVFYNPGEYSFSCQCSLYPYSHAVFKCKSTRHGLSWTDADNAPLLETLSGLNASQEYNLLLLGATGIGKSTFINAFVNYLEFESLDAALNDREPLRFHIPTHFKYEELVNEPHGRGPTEPYDITVGEETEGERLSRTGQSATSRSRIYNFSIGPAMIRIIDTPGMCDTQGAGQDEKNIQDILKTLESVDKLSGIMVMLPIVQPRVTDSFQRYMTDLLSSIHADASENILFGFPSANSTQWRTAGNQIVLNQTLDQLKLKNAIRPNAKNQFMFEAEPFKYLAACKQLRRELPGKEKYDAMWKTSCGQIYQLIERLEELPVHEVGKTLCLRRTRDLLRGMPKPLTKIISAMQESRGALERIKKNLSELKTDDERFNDKLNELQIPIFVLTRKDLPNPRIVCSKHPCDKKKACHDNCDIVSPDDVKGDPAIKGCYTFRKWVVLHYGNCDACGHDWTEHMRVSYEMVREVKPVYDWEKDMFTRQLENNQEKENAVKVRMELAEKAIKEINQEADRLHIARAKFQLYLERNAMVKEGSRYSDETASTLDNYIRNARNNSDCETVQELERQQKTYEDKRVALEHTIISEADINETIEVLKRMKHYGESFDSAVKHETFALSAEQRNVYSQAGQGNGLVKRLAKSFSGMSM